ncbi:MAG: phosphotransferase [Paracoccaceae bacterium]
MTGTATDHPAADRAALSRDFVRAAGWGAADRRFLAGDASDRSYDRLTLPGQSAVLMDAPPGKGDDPAAFVVIADHLRSLGLSAPRCLARDLEHGFLLLEDLGDAVFARLIAADPALEQPLYAAATDVLVRIQSHPPAAGLPDLSARDWADAADFAPGWYAFGATGQRPDSAGFRQIMGDLLAAHADGPRIMILRDYHAENLIWLPGREGVARVGLLDFQLAQMGQPGYDLVSLLQDARRDVTPAAEQAMIARFVAATGVGDGGFRRAYAVLGAQRALRILGIFARLCLVGGKPHYLGLIPRVWGQLQANLAAPGMEALAEACARLLPPPTPAVLAEIGKKCATISP